MNERNDANESLHQSLFCSLNYHLSDKGLTETERDKKDEFNKKHKRKTNKRNHRELPSVDMKATVRSHGFLSYISRYGEKWANGNTPLCRSKQTLCYVNSQYKNIPTYCCKQAAPQTSQTVRSQLCCDIMVFFMMSACSFQHDWEQTSAVWFG